MSSGYVLLTRPLPDSLLLQAHLDLMGIKSLIAPVLSIRPAPHSFDWAEVSHYRAALITSRNTVPFLNSPPFKENIPLISIGKETSQHLVNKGFNVFYEADGTSRSLKGWMEAEGGSLLEAQNAYCKNGPGKEYIHFGGVHVSDLFRTNIMDNFSVRHVPLYEAVAADSFPEEVMAALTAQKISRILFYSARSAAIFEALCVRLGLVYALKQIQVLCLAPSVVKSLKEDLWGGIHLARTPETSALLALLEK
ncbi:MAG: uroporphyrinogen-III synthase [Rhodospirillales bacterium]|nr:uroporphyrinogen-III synthase [Rhodospirillales bacterium]